MSLHARREVLAVLGAATTAGCLGSLTGESDDGVRLGSLHLERTRDTEGEFEDVTEREIGDGDATDVDGGRTYPIRLTREGEVAFQAGVTLREGEYVVVEPTWSTAPATYEFLYGWPDGVDRVEIPADTESVDGDTCNHVRLLVGTPEPTTRPMLWVRPREHRAMQGIDRLSCP